MYSNVSIGMQPHTVKNKINTDNERIGWIESICTKCLQSDACLCDAQRYCGMICKTQTSSDDNTNNIVHRAYVASPYINELIKICESAKKFKIVTMNISMPPFSLPPSYDYMSKPYFTSKKDAICILEGIPHVEKLDMYSYPLFFLNSVHECMLSDNGTCVHRKAYFGFAGKEYPFGLLVIAPFFLQQCLDTIQSNECSIYRDTEKTVFCSTVFFKKLPMEGIEAFIDHMFATVNAYGKYMPHEAGKDIDPGFEKIFEKYTSIIEKEKKLIVKDSIDFVRFALCAKLLDNTYLAKSFLQLYDHIEKHIGCDPTYYNKIGIKPLAGVYSDGCKLRKIKNQEGLNIKSYEDILDSLTSFTDIENQVTKFKQQRYMIPISKDVSIEIQKNGTDYSIYPWQLRARKDIGCYLTTDWFRGKKFSLTHCAGTITGGYQRLWDRIGFPMWVSYGPLGHLNDTYYPKIEKVNTLYVYEERTNLDGTKARITHTLNANKITSADQNGKTYNIQKVLPILKNRSTYLFSMASQIIKNIVRIYYEII
jgi:hypothetical protein